MNGDVPPSRAAAGHQVAAWPPNAAGRVLAAGRHKASCHRACHPACPNWLLSAAGVVRRLTGTSCFTGRLHGVTSGQGYAACLSAAELPTSCAAQSRHKSTQPASTLATFPAVNLVVWGLTSSNLAISRKPIIEQRLCTQPPSVIMAFRPSFSALTRHSVLKCRGTNTHCDRPPTATMIVPSFL